MPPARKPVRGFFADKGPARGPPTSDGAAYANRCDCSESWPCGCECGTVRIVRHGRNMKKKRITPWPDQAPTPDALARQVTYVGSAEHKDHPSPAGPPRLRHNDASSCDPRYATFEEPTRALREAVKARCTSDFVGRFPKYAWGSLDGRLYEARLVNQELGTYKAYKLEKAAELPEDPARLLEAIPQWQL